MSRSQAVSVSLGYAGLIPFFIAIALILMEQTIWGVEGLLLFTSYSAIILSFLAGALWGRVIDRSSVLPIKPAILIVSNLFALWAWAGMLAGRADAAIIVLAIGFALLIAVETYLFKENEPATKPLELQAIDEEAQGRFCYAQLRRNLTVMVVGLHVGVIAL
ncbi:DUF3429 domain-containing protein [Corallincola holothuriorum]|uniref:DUF3429 domain-containing protein n=1 Tax=Corallincola holothuriorum TaxID=2282215 RepID=A0A368NQM6_9GAMM|nr:DUF3429 domain-containing protein [Corallincola holothuriorum]RCU52446.1 DUF3429 domain-containing protein [Corallincola holothuriorum]